MPPPRFQHGFAHDVFISYTHTDDQPSAGRNWVTQFHIDLKERLESVSGHTVDIWRDAEKLGASDRFNETIAQAVRNSAVLLVVLSPSYFNSAYCKQERQEFYDHILTATSAALGTKSPVVKVAKFFVSLEKYPADLKELLEHKFYVQSGPTYREFHLSEDDKVQRLYYSRVDDVAQEVAGLLTALEPAAPAVESKGLVYLAEATSDVEQERDDLRRHLHQLGYEVEPRAELRLLPAADIRRFVSDSIQKARLVVHPVGAYFGVVPEGAEGKSLVQIQLELSRADRRNGDLSRIIWVPEGLQPREPAQGDFLNQLRTEYAGRGFEFLERPFRVLATQVEERLKAASPAVIEAAATSGVYLICHNDDRVTAKMVRSFLFNQRCDVEWTPISIAAGELTGNPEHEKLLRRNRAHLVLHGDTKEGWLQDRIRELNAVRTPGTAPIQAIYLAEPHRGDKDDLLVRDVLLLNAYLPVTVADAVQPFLAELGQVSSAPRGPQ
jgi:hypothetical protein